MASESRRRPGVCLIDHRRLSLLRSDLLSFSASGGKYLKAIIVADDLEFQKIHDLLVLLKACSVRRPELNSLIPDCKLLNRYYIDTRYPVHWPTDYSKEKAFQAQAAAISIRDMVKESIKQRQKR